MSINQYRFNCLRNWTHLERCDWEDNFYVYSRIWRFLSENLLKTPALSVGIHFSIANREVKVNCMTTVICVRVFTVRYYIVERTGARIIVVNSVFLQSTDKAQQTGAQIASQVRGRDGLIKFISKPSSRISANIFLDLFHPHSWKQLIIPKLINFFNGFRKKKVTTLSHTKRPRIIEDEVWSAWCRSSITDVEMSLSKGLREKLNLKPF